MSEEAQHKIDEAEYTELMKAVGDSVLSALEKDNLRELLAAGYRNLNGDPMEEKVKLLARTDWIQIKHTLADTHWKMSIAKMLADIKDELKQNRDGRPTNVWDTLVAAKKDIRYIAIAACIFPGGAALVSALQKVFGGG